MSDTSVKPFGSCVATVAKVTVGVGSALAKHDAEEGSPNPVARSFNKAWGGIRGGAAGLLWSGATIAKESCDALESKVPASSKPWGAAVGEIKTDMANFLRKYPSSGK